MVPTYKGKGDLLNTNSCTSINLLEHAFKLNEKILSKILREIVETAKIQYCFTPGQGTVDAGFILWRLTEKYQ